MPLTTFRVMVLLVLVHLLLITGTGNVSIANGKLTTLASTGATGITGATTITTTSALGLAVGRQGATDPVLRIDAGTSSVATGIRITGAAAAGGVAVAAISSGTDESLTINAKGAGTVTINGTATGNIVMGRAVTGVSSFGYWLAYFTFGNGNSCCCFGRCWS
jgi:hypothetical protein